MPRRVPRPGRGGMSCRWVSCGGRDEPDGDDADGCAARRCLRSLSCFSRRCRLALPTKQTSLASTLRKILPRGTDKPRERHAGSLTALSRARSAGKSGSNRSPTEIVPSDRMSAFSPPAVDEILDDAGRVRRRTPPPGGGARGRLTAPGSPFLDCGIHFGVGLPEDRLRYTRGPWLVHDRWYANSSRNGVDHRVPLRPAREQAPFLEPLRWRECPPRSGTLASPRLTARASAATRSVAPSRWGRSGGRPRASRRSGSCRGSRRRIRIGRRSGSWPIAWLAARRPNRGGENPTNAFSPGRPRPHLAVSPGRSGDASLPDRGR